MATRFYLPSTGTAPLNSLAVDASWGRSDSLVRLPCDVVKSNTSLTQKSATWQVTTTGDWVWAQFQSKRLAADYSWTSDTVSMVIKVAEAAAQVDSHLAYCIRVVSGDGSTVRGTIGVFQATSSEYPTSLASIATRIHDARGDGTGTFSSQAGDRIIIEIGHWGVTPTANVVYHNYGDPSATSDYALTAGLTTDLCPWVQLSRTVSFVLTTSKAAYMRGTTAATPTSKSAYLKGQTAVSSSKSAYLFSDSVFVTTSKAAFLRGPDPKFASKVGSFNIDTTKTVGQDQVITIDIEPKIVLFWWGGGTETGDVVAGGNIAFGMGAASSSTSRRCTTCFSADGAAISSTSWEKVVDAVIRIHSAESTLDGAADFKSNDVNGFTITITDQFTNAYRINYLAIGGSDITDVFVGTARADSDTGDWSETDIGFPPDALLFLGAPATASTASATIAYFSLGMGTDASKQGIIASYSNDGATTSSTYGYGYNGEISGLVTADTIIRRDALVSLDAGGFTCNRLETAHASYIYVVALKGGQYSVGELTTRTDGNDIIGTVGFQPSAILFASANRALDTQDVSTVHARISIGAAVSASERVCAAISDENGLTDTETAYANYNSAVYANIVDDAIVGKMDLKSVESNGFICVMDDTDPAGCWVTYLAMGPSGNSSSNKSAYLNGGIVATPSNKPAYIKGLIAATPASKSAYIHGLVSDTSDNQSAFTKGEIVVSDNQASFVQGKTSATPDNQNAFVQGKIIATPDSQNAYTKGGVGVLDSQSAYLRGRTDATPDNQSAYTKGISTLQIDNQLAYTKGKSDATPTNQSAYTNGVISVVDNQSAYTEGYSGGGPADSSHSVFTIGFDNGIIPDSDITVSGVWWNELNSPNNLYQSIDEVTANDSDYIWDTNPMSNHYYECSLSNPPGTPGSGEVVVFWRGKDSSGSEKSKANVELRQGTTIIASGQEVLTSVPATYHISLTPTEKDNITDWNDLRLRITVIIL